MHSKEELGDNGFERDVPVNGRGHWEIALRLWQRRRLIAIATLATTVLAVIIALVLPREYAAEARVLQPERSPLSLLGMQGGAAAGLGSLLMSSSGPYTRYLAILSSNSSLLEMVERFDLVREYGLESRRNPEHAAVERLRKNVDLVVDRDLNYLSIIVLDRDPERAAAMSNHLVHILNRRNAELGSESARQTRVFVEARLNRAMADLDSVRAVMQGFQEEHGLVELESQAQAFMQSVALRRGEAAQLEVQYQALAAQYGPDNPRVEAARNAVRAAQAQMTGALGGREALLPVSLRNLPAVSRRYAELMQNQLIQAQVIETIYPLYEQALFQERSETSAVQVLDVATPPIQPAKPSRRMIVLIGTLSAFLLACVFVIAQDWAGRVRHQYDTYARGIPRATVS